METIPLSEIARDARDLLAAFRNSGGISFQDLPLDQARRNYRIACATNGLTQTRVMVVRDHEIHVPEGVISVREYRPNATESIQPAILFIHGGGWVLGDLDTHDAICRALANRAGAVVLAVDYRLAPEHMFPVPLHDCAAALGWVAEHHEALRIDVKNLALVGDSAGGNLAAVLANTDDLRPAGVMFQALALIYPVVDLRCNSNSYTRIQSGVPLTASSMAWFRQCYVPAASDVNDPRLSPLLSRIADIPLFIATCGLDPLCDEGVEYARAAVCAGVSVEHHHFPRHAHGILTSAGKIATGQKLTWRMADFIKENLAESDASKTF